MPTAPRIFVSYSHKDKEHLDRLQLFLRPLERQNLVSRWDDTRIGAGDKWRAEIEEALQSAKIGILLVSQDFLSSDFIQDKELPRLLQAAQDGGLRILTVILSPSTFRHSPLSEFQAINAPDTPLISMQPYEREALWVRVSDAVYEAAQDLASRSAPEASDYVASAPLSVEKLIRQSLIFKAEADEAVLEEDRKKLLNEAYGLLKQALRQDPTSTEAMLESAVLLMELTPDDPSDELRLLERVRKVLSSPKTDEELFCLARATFMLAQQSNPPNREALEDAKGMFERLGKTDLVRKCKELLGGAESSSPSQPQATELTCDPRQSLQSPQQEVFNPIGSWVVQCTDGSTMTGAFAPNGQFQMNQTNPAMGINVNAVGQWGYVPAMGNLQMQGLIQGFLPFTFSVFITGHQGGMFIGHGADGHAYQFTRTG